MQKVATLVLTSLVLCSCGREQSPSGNTAGNAPADAITAGGTESGLRSEAEAEAAAQKALQGDPGAAWALSFYFREHNDPQRVAYWEQLAIQNLSGPAIATVGGSLLYKSDVCSKLRGIYLIEFGVRVLPADKKHFVDEWMPEVGRAKEQVKGAKDTACLKTMPQ